MDKITVSPLEVAKKAREAIDEFENSSKSYADGEKLENLLNGFGYSVTWRWELTISGIHKNETEN